MPGATVAAVEVLTRAWAVFAWAVSAWAGAVRAAANAPPRSAREASSNSPR